jgi:hypothetical protein
LRYVVAAPSQDVRDELTRAFAELRPRMRELAEANASVDPKPRLDEFSDADIEQFVNAYEAMFLEALQGESRQVRELVFDTALEPMMASGQTALDMLRSNVISSVTMSHRLLRAVREDVREDAVLWLAGFYSSYTAELAERALAIEAGRE